MNLELELFLELLTEISRLPEETKNKIGRLVAKTEKRVSELTLGELALLSDIVQGKNDALKNPIYRESADC
jgi:hypothetical protein